jgi:succinate--hydroxymethylglutarate CoA-transferase
MLTPNSTQANRNKKSLALSFNNPTGISILHSLVRECDILVENYLPGSLAKYKLDYETVSALNPSLIYASVTGYGQTGPYRDRAGYDVMVEAEMGLMHITGERDRPPVKVGVAVTDIMTGMYTAIGIQAALLSRRETGLGQWIDASLSDCQVAGLANIASSCLVTGKPDSGRWGTAHGKHISPFTRSFFSSRSRFWHWFGEGWHMAHVFGYRLIFSRSNGGPLPGIQNKRH